MLALPEFGMAVSVERHNVDLGVLCDWIESSALFVEPELPDSAVVECLVEEEVYEQQGFAWQIVADAWNIIRRRQKWIAAASPLDVSDHRITRHREWSETPALGFCLCLALAPLYPRWSRAFGKDFTEQGELFEALAKSAAESLFPGWLIEPTGWSRSQTKALTEIVNRVAQVLGESVGEIKKWTKPRAKEAGLDLLCYRPFPDMRVGVPVYLMQCASGRDWEQKLHTPRLEISTKIVQFAARPRKAFAMPFALLDDEFPMNCNSVDGLVLDRYRLLSVGRPDAEWIAQQLRQRIVRWATPRVEALPRG